MNVLIARGPGVQLCPRVYWDAKSNQVFIKLNVVGGQGSNREMSVAVVCVSGCVTLLRVRCWIPLVGCTAVLHVPTPISAFNSLPLESHPSSR